MYKANVILVGENDDNEQYISVKQMDTGEQTTISLKNDDLSLSVSQIVMSLKI